MMATIEQIRTIQRFNDKVMKLERFSFFQEPRQVGFVVEWKRGIGWEGIHIGPEEESTDAVVLSLRFFMQDNEPTSLKNMSKTYPALGISPDIVDNFLRLRQGLNNYLDKHSNLSISDNKQLTHREILDMFLWGNLSHANAQHEATYQAVSKTAFFPLFQADFVVTVRNFIQTLRLMSNVNEDALRELHV